MVAAAVLGKVSYVTKPSELPCLWGMVLPSHEAARLLCIGCHPRSGCYVQCGLTLLVLTERSGEGDAVPRGSGKLDTALGTCVLGTRTLTGVFRPSDGPC